MTPGLQLSTTRRHLTVCPVGCGTSFCFLRTSGYSIASTLFHGYSESCARRATGETLGLHDARVKLSTQSVLQCRTRQAWGDGELWSTEPESYLMSGDGTIQLRCNYDLVM